MTPLVDGHLDLAWNAVGFERDLTLPVEVINASERGVRDNPGRGGAVVSLPEMRRGNVALCFATLLARGRTGRTLPAEGPRRVDLDHQSAVVAHCTAHAQLAWYESMQRRGELRLIRTVADLDEHWQTVRGGPLVGPIGMVLAMEGADPVTEPAELEHWFDRGLRQINLVHYGVNRYAAGTGAEGGLTADGRELVRQCERLDVAIDVTHLADQAFFETVDAYRGPVLASHQNCRELVPGQRQFSDEQLRLLIDRGAVIGAALDNWMLHPAWKTGTTPREAVTLDHVADHVDRVCQLAGHHHAAAIGTDLDGGYGREQTPAGVDSIADVQKLAAILADRGYRRDAIDAIFHGNWLRWLHAQLPKAGSA